MSKYSSAPSGRELSLYGLAGGGQVFGYSLIVGYLSYYSINVLLIDPKTVGLLLLVQGLWDVVNNPLAGLLLDRRRGKEKAPRFYENARFHCLSVRHCFSVARICCGASAQEQTRRSGILPWFGFFGRFYIP